MMFRNVCIDCTDGTLEEVHRFLRENNWHICLDKHISLPEYMDKYGRWKVLVLADDYPEEVTGWGALRYVKQDYEEQGLELTYYTGQEYLDQFVNTEIAMLKLMETLKP